MGPTRRRPAYAPWRSKAPRSAPLLQSGIKTQAVRINNLIAALDEHHAASDALKAELGIPEADDLVDKLFDSIHDIAHRMKAIEPTTILGLQAKAKMLFYWYWSGDEDEDGDGDPVTVEIIKGLVGAKLAA